MAFNEDVRLPEDVERNMNTGIQWNTTKITLANAFNKSNKNWALPLKRFDVSYGISLKPDLDEVIDIFYVVNGGFGGFRVKDWADFEIGDSFGADDTTRQSIGSTDGSTATFQVFQHKVVGSATFDIPKVKLVSGTVRVWVNDVEVFEGGGGSQFTVDLTTGIITLGATLAAQSGTVVAVILQFDEPVQFDTDLMNIDTTVFHIEAVISIPAIPLLELRGV